MPNWCKNFLAVQGPEEDVRRFASYARSTREGESSVLSFEEIIPLLGDRTCSAAREAWGTKWDATDVRLLDREPGSVRYGFETPWGPPTRFLLSASNLMPTLRLGLVYLVEQCGGGGLEIVTEGELVAEEHEAECSFSRLGEFCAKAGAPAMEPQDPAYWRQMANDWLNPPDRAVGCESPAPALGRTECDVPAEWKGGVKDPFEF